MAVERPRIVPILNGVEQRGLATRRVRGVDRRNRRIALTDAGASLLAELKRGLLSMRLASLGPSAPTGSRCMRRGRRCRACQRWAAWHLTDQTRS